MTPVRIRVATYNVHKCRGLDRRTSPERVCAWDMHGKAPLLTMVKGSNWQVSDIGDLKGDHVWEHGDRWRCVARQRDGRQR